MHVSGYDWTYLWNSMWCVIITMTTVGYGDFVAKTQLGRIIAIMACIWGNFLISLMVISLTVSSEFTVPAHRKAYDSIVRSQEEQKNRVLAARVIQSLLGYNVASRK
jgi:voltage-gated potassium channel Kch